MKLKKFIKAIKLFSISLLVLSASSLGLAQSDLPSDLQTKLNSFQSFYTPVIPELVKPTVVSLELNSAQRYGIVVLENENPTPQAWQKITQYSNPVSVVESSPLIGAPSSLSDNKYQTFAEFDLDQDSSEAFVVLESKQTFSSNSLSLSLEDNVELPDNIAIQAWIENDWKTLKAFDTLDSLRSSYIDFPETSAQKWKIQFKHYQPLRLNEITLNESKSGSNKTTEYRWLARPDKTYTIYADSENSVYIPTAESGDLKSSSLDVTALEKTEAQVNPNFTEADSDNDGLIDKNDNCPYTANPDQIDVDANQKGDACEDFDGDGISNLEDNCPEHANYAQYDEDHDGIGDTCDSEESRPIEKMPWLPWAGMSLNGYANHESSKKFRNPKLNTFRDFSSNFLAFSAKNPLHSP